MTTTTLADLPAILHTLRSTWQAQRPTLDQRENDLRRLREALRPRLDEMAQAIAEGIIDDHPVGELTHLLVAAVEEAALLVAHADKPAKARERAARVLDRLLLSFAVEPRKVLRR